MAITFLAGGRLHISGLKLDMGFRPVTGDLLYFLAFGMLAALVIVPALLLMHKASPRRFRGLRSTRSNLLMCY